MEAEQVFDLLHKHNFQKIYKDSMKFVEDVARQNKKLRSELAFDKHKQALSSIDILKDAVDDAMMFFHKQRKALDKLAESLGKKIDSKKEPTTKKDTQTKKASEKIACYLKHILNDMVKIAKKIDKDEKREQHAKGDRIFFEYLMLGMSTNITVNLIAKMDSFLSFAKELEDYEQMVKEGLVEDWKGGNNRLNKRVVKTIDEMSNNFKASVQILTQIRTKIINFGKKVKTNGTD